MDDWYSQVCVWLYGVATGEGKMFNVVETLDDSGDGGGCEVCPITHIEFHQPWALVHQQPQVWITTQHNHHHSTTKILIITEHKHSPWQHTTDNYNITLTSKVLCVSCVPYRHVLINPDCYIKDFVDRQIDRQTNRQRGVPVALRESERVLLQPERLRCSNEGGKRRHTTRKSSVLNPVQAKLKLCSLWVGEK